MSAPLHVIHRLEALAACRTRLSEGAGILLTDEAAPAALAAHPADLAPGVAIFVLKDALMAHGLAGLPLKEGVRLANMAEFVALTVAHNPIVAWN